MTTKDTTTGEEKKEIIKMPVKKTKVIQKTASVISAPLAAPLTPTVISTPLAAPAAAPITAPVA